MKKLSQPDQNYLSPRTAQNKELHRVNPSTGRITLSSQGPKDGSEQGLMNTKKQVELTQRLEKELVKVRYMNSQLLLAQRKREEMISFILDENRKLRSEIDEINKEIQKKDQQIRFVESKRLMEQQDKEQIWIKLKELQTVRNIHASSKNLIPILNRRDYQISAGPLTGSMIQKSHLPSVPMSKQDSLRSVQINQIYEIAAQERPPLNTHSSSPSFSKSPKGSNSPNRVGSQTFGNRHISIAKKKSSNIPMYLDENYMRQPPGMRSGFGLDKKDSNELSLFSDYLGKNSVLKFSHEQIDEVLQSDKILNLKRLLENSESLREEISNCSDFKIEEYLLQFKAMLNDVQRLSHLLLRLKTLLLNSYSISKNLSLSEALEKIVDATCETLDCDRASVFMVDEITGELWSKVAKDSEHTIRIPITSGIVGHVVTNNQIENIEDAYKDIRFNKEIDKKNNYRTKTIICVPLRDQYGNVIGACQAINKFSDSKFNPDDEYIFETLALNAGLILRNSMQYDQSIVFQHKLRNLIHIGIKLTSKIDVIDMLLMTENLISEAFGVDHAYIYLVDNEKKQIVRYLHGGEVRAFPMDAGLVGLAISKKEILSISDAYNHQSYNGRVDIDTSMPVLVKPIMSIPQSTAQREIEEQQNQLDKKGTMLSRINENILDEAKLSKANRGEPLACLEVINKLGVVGRSTRHKANMDPLDSEMLDLFEKQFRSALTVFKLHDKVKE